jgi:hypothetical protein
MNIRIVNYTTSASPLVQAFVSVEIDGWLRLNGLNYLRDGMLKPAQLTYHRDHHRHYLDAVQVLDTDLAQSLAAEIAQAIQAHIALLPEAQRLKTPAPSRRGPKKAEPAAPKAIPPPAALPPLPPPLRLPGGVNRSPQKPRPKDALK